MSPYSNLAKQLLPAKAYHNLMHRMDGDSSNGNPYHNPAHMKRVALRAHEFGKTRLNQEDLLLLFVAASYHDMGYRVGKNITDRTNIESAVMIVHVDMQEFFQADALDIIKNAIRCTEYPYVVEPVNAIQRILRDCDLMMCLEPDWILFKDGLIQEMKHKDSEINFTLRQHGEWVLSQRFFYEENRQQVQSWFNQLKAA